MTIFIRTIIPIFLLMGLGSLARATSVLKAGDERVLSKYIYYFALPALFFVNLAELKFSRDMIEFILAGAVPILIIFFLYLLIYKLTPLSKEMFYLLAISTVFGSHAFFGIPFVMFAFSNSVAEQHATVSASTMSIVSIIIVITMLELYVLGRQRVARLPEALKHVSIRLPKNPLIISVVLGIIVSLSGVPISIPISRLLHMLGNTTATVAIFMLGVFFYGRRYKNIFLAFKLSVLRIIFLPFIALLVAEALGVTGMERSIAVLMNGMPVAISMIVLCERYDFYKETVSSLILISSLISSLSLNVWLLLIG